MPIDTTQAPDNDRIAQLRAERDQAAAAYAATPIAPPETPLGEQSASELARTFNPSVTPGPSGPTLTPQLAPAGPPDPVQIKANSPYAVQAPAVPKPPDPPGLAGTMYETTTTRSTSTSGLSDKDRATAESRLDAARDAHTQATDAELEAKRARTEYEIRATEQALSEQAEKARKVAAEQAINDRVRNEVDRRMQAASDWQPDRYRVFSGPTGVARGIAAAVAVIAGGWMQGRGMTATNQFLPLVLKMIDEDVADQVRSNSANIQFLREQKGDLQAAALELKKRQLQIADAEIQARAAEAAAKDPSVAAALDAQRKRTAAEYEKLDTQQRNALLRSTTEQVSRVTSPVHVGGSGTAPSAVQMNASIRLGDLSRIMNDLDEAQSSGDLKSVTGYQAKLGGWLPGGNAWYEAIGGLPPGQQKALNAMRDLQNLQYQAFEKEPNGPVAAVLAQIGIAKNDRDIPVMMQRLREKRDILNRAMKAQEQGGADPTRGAY